jgi:DNA invertase Pin-like site-specific DNA recombinase
MVAYARLSYAPDGSLESVERQLALIHAAAERVGYRITREYIDNGVSAWNTTVYREGWETLLDTLAHSDRPTLWTYHGDRLTRNGRDGERLLTVGRAVGLTICTVDGQRLDLANDEARLMWRISTAVAIHSSDRTAARVRDAMRARRRAGVVDMVGYGWKRAPGGTVTPDYAESEHLRMAACLLLAGEPWRVICQALEQAGARTKRGLPLDPVQIRKALRAPRTAGLIDIRGEIQPERLPGIPPLDLDTWRAVCELLDSRNRPGRPARRGLLTGLIRCAHCGNTISGSVVETMVRDAVIEWQSKPEHETLTSTGDTSDDLRAERVRLQALAVALFDSFHAGIIGEESYRERAELLAKEIAETQAELDSLSSFHSDVAQRLDAVRLAYDHATVGDKRQAIRQAVSSVTVARSSGSTSESAIRARVGISLRD